MQNKGKYKRVLNLDELPQTVKASFFTEHFRVTASVFWIYISHDFKRRNWNIFFWGTSKQIWQLSNIISRFTKVGVNMINDCDVLVKLSLSLLKEQNPVLQKNFYVIIKTSEVSL